jgi:hypothetical protein
MIVSTDRSFEDIRDHVVLRDPPLAWYGYMLFNIGRVNNARLSQIERILMSVGVHVVEIADTDSDETLIFSLLPMVGKSYCSLHQSEHGKAYLPILTLSVVCHIRKILELLHVSADMFVLPFAEDPNIRWKIEFE